MYFIHSLDYLLSNNKVIYFKHMYLHFNEVKTTDYFIYLLGPEQPFSDYFKMGCYVVVLDWGGSGCTLFSSELFYI